MVPLVSPCCGPGGAAGSKSGVSILEDKKPQVEGVKERLPSEGARLCNLSLPSLRPLAREPQPGNAERWQGDDARPRGEHHLSAARLHQDVLDHVLQQRLLQVSESREPAGREAGAPRSALTSPRPPDSVLFGVCRVLYADSHLTPPSNTVRNPCSSFINVQTMA